MRWSALSDRLLVVFANRKLDQGANRNVDHSGDSDSTGSMTGNLLGGLLGKSKIPKEWLDRLELGQEIETLATDLWRHCGDSPEQVPPDIDWERYPGS